MSRSQGLDQTAAMALPGLAVLAAAAFGSRSGPNPRAPRATRALASGSSACWGGFALLLLLQEGIWRGNR